MSEVVLTAAWHYRLARNLSILFIVLTIAALVALPVIWPFIIFLVLLLGSGGRMYYVHTHSWNDQDWESSESPTSLSTKVSEQGLSLGTIRF